ncbi:MAG: CHC2 zinc finger domain-containing protein [bacterium]|nr:CHC2 zinc finger domain-containing protein [bacterium]
MFNATEEIKSRLDIVDFIQQYVRLEKSGINWRANCPFHQERTPSFFVSKARQRWHCFGGCGEGGDIFSFLMKIEGLEFPDALAVLAKRAGVEIKREDPRVQSERNHAYAICESAAVWFAGELQKSSLALEYLKGRGLTEKTIADFRIGFAPEGWRNLLEYLVAKGFRADDIEKAGLAIKKSDTPYSASGTSGYYDRFRSRIIFPISDANGRVIAFGGRVFEPQTHAEKTQNNAETGLRDSALAPLDAGLSNGVNQHSSAAAIAAKYINSPQTPIYNKSRVLYAFDKAKQPIREKNSCVLVEGYMDAVMSHQAGVANTVAVSGTALTDHQLRAIRRLTDTLVSSFDSDSAGERAAKRSLDLATTHDFKRLVAVIPSEEGKDPADIVVKNPARWEEIVAGARPVMDYYFETACARYDIKNPDGKKAIAGELIPHLAILVNEIEKSHWVRRLSGELSVPEESVWKELAKFSVRSNDEHTPFADTPAESRGRTRIEELEARLVGALLMWPEKASLLAGAPTMGKEFFASAFHGTLFEMLKAGKPVSVGTGQGTESEMQDLMFRAEVAFQNVEKKDDEIVLCAREIYKEKMKGRLTELSQKIKDAERNHEAEHLDGLVRDFQETSRQMNAFL